MGLPFWWVGYVDYRVIDDGVDDAIGCIDVTEVA